MTIRRFTSPLRASALLLVLASTGCAVEALSEEDGAFTSGVEAVAQQEESLGLVSGIAPAVVPIRCSSDANCPSGTLCDAPRCKPHGQASSTANACVPNVARAFDAIAMNSEVKHRVYVPSVRGNVAGYSTDAFWPGNLASRKDNCHIQGFARLLKPGFLAFTANSVADSSGINGCNPLAPGDGGGAHLFIAQLPSKRALGAEGEWRKAGGGSDDRIVREVRVNYDGVLGERRDDWRLGLDTLRTHPGGIQAVGDYVFVGYDGDADIARMKAYNVRDPLRPFPVAKGASKSKNASAVGAVALADGTLLVAVGDLRNSGKRDLHFYTVDPEARDWWFEPQSTVSLTGRTTPFPFEPYSAINFVQECGTKDIYMVGITNTADWPMCVADGSNFGNVGGTDRGKFDLYKVVMSDSDPHRPTGLVSVKHRASITNNASACAGAGVYVTPAGHLVGYTMEHSSDDGAVRFYEYGSSVPSAGASPPPSPHRCPPGQVCSVESQVDGTCNCVPRGQPPR